MKVFTRIFGIIMACLIIFFALGCHAEEAPLLNGLTEEQSKDILRVGVELESFLLLDQTDQLEKEYSLDDGSLEYYYNEESTYTYLEYVRNKRLDEQRYEKFYLMLRLEKKADLVESYIGSVESLLQMGMILKEEGDILSERIDQFQNHHEVEYLIRFILAITTYENSESMVGGRVSSEYYISYVKVATNSSATTEAVIGLWTLASEYGLMVKPKDFNLIDTNIIVASMERIQLATSPSDDYPFNRANYNISYVTDQLKSICTFIENQG